MCRRKWTPSNAVRLAHIAYLHPCGEQLSHKLKYVDTWIDVWMLVRVTMHWMTHIEIPYG